MKQFIFIFACVAIISCNNISTKKCVEKKVTNVDDLISEGNLLEANKNALEDYRLFPRGHKNVYDLAVTYALMQKSDSSFKYLYKAIEIDTELSPLYNSQFLILRNDAKWFAFEDKLIDMYEIKTKTKFVKKDYAKQLLKLNAIDQQYYDEESFYNKKLGRVNSISRIIWDLKNRNNKQNQIDLIELINKYGVPKKSEVGDIASDAFFLIFQHSGDINLMKKYLPAIKKLVDENEMKKSNYAYIYDRIQNNENKPQRFGTQLNFDPKQKKYIMPKLEDSTKVNELRKEYNMEPIENYIKLCNQKDNS